MTLSFEPGELCGKVVHVWLVDLDQPGWPSDALAALLSPDELARAARQRTDRNRARYATARALLRILLGAYLNRPAADIEFRYGSFGKPYVLTSEDDVDVQFNVTHSGGSVLLAFGQGVPIGVDLEALRPFNHLDRFADRFFTPEEATQIRNTDSAGRLAAFFRCWARKEAYVKARGEGLSKPLNCFRVMESQEQTPRLEWVAGEADEPRRWSMHDLLVGPGLVGALALRREASDVLCRPLRACYLTEPASRQT